MLLTFKNGQTSVILRAKLLDSSSTTGAGLTGLTSASTGLIISTIADNESSATAYTVAGSTIETITTLGTYAAPTATKCRFKEVDATNHPGVYEFQFADARFAVSSAKSLLVSVSGATNLQQTDFVVQLQSDDPFVAKPSNFASLSIDGSGRVDVGKWLGTAVTLTSSLPDVNAKDIGGTAQTGADIGAASANLDATVSSRLATSSYTSPPSAATIATTVWDADMGAHDISGTAGWQLTTVYTDALNISAIKTKTDSLTFTVAGVVDANVVDWKGATAPANTGDAYARLGVPSGASIAADIAAVPASTWDIDVGAHDISGTFGWELQRAGNAGDPWATAVPGTYSAGQAGFILGTNLDATVSSRLPTASISLAGGAVTVGTNNDKTGYALTAAYDAAKTAAQPSDIPSGPTIASDVWNADMGAHDISGTAGWQLTSVDTLVAANLDATVSSRLAASSISLSGGAVTVGTNNDKSGYALTQAFPGNFSSLSIDASGNVAIAGNLKKNTAKNGFMFVMTDTTNHNPLTGLTVAATRSIDGAVFASCSNAVSEVASGTYKIDLSAADMNGDHIMLRFTATGADDLNIEIVTQP